MVVLSRRTGEGVNIRTYSSVRSRPVKKMDDARHRRERACGMCVCVCKFSKQLSGKWQDYELLNGERRTCVACIVPNGKRVAGRVTGWVRDLRAVMPQARRSKSTIVVLVRTSPRQKTSARTVRRTIAVPPYLYTYRPVLGTVKK